MKAEEARTRHLVDRMLREAGAANRYEAGGKERFFDIRTPEFRDGAELRALHFVETGTKLGKSFRKANPMIPWEDLVARPVKLADLWTGGTFRGSPIPPAWCSGFGT